MLLQYGKSGTGQSNQSWMSPLHPRLAVDREALRCCKQPLRVSIAEAALSSAPPAKVRVWRSILRLRALCASMVAHRLENCAYAS